MLGLDDALFLSDSSSVQIGTEKDESPSQSADFDFTDLHVDFKIDSRNLHAGRGLQYPSRSFLRWGMMIERIRTSELSLECQLFLGGSADEKVKLQILRRVDVCQAFYSALGCSDSPPVWALQHADALHYSMLNYMWNADTPRRLRALRLKFGVFKSINVQHTTRGKVAAQPKAKK